MGSVFMKPMNKKDTRTDKKYTPLFRSYTLVTYAFFNRSIVEMWNIIMDIDY